MYCHDLHKSGAGFNTPANQNVADWPDSLTCHGGFRHHYVRAKTGALGRNILRDMHSASGDADVIRNVDSDAENNCLNKSNSVATCSTGRHHYGAGQVVSYV